MGRSSLPVWLPVDPLFPAVAVLVVVETLSVVCLLLQSPVSILFLLMQYDSVE